MRRRAAVAPLGCGKVLYLSGSPYEQGRQLGAGAADLIRENLALTRTQRQEVVTGLDRTDYEAITRRNERWRASAATPARGSRRRTPRPLTVRRTGRCG